MATQMEILEREEQEALEQFQKAQTPPDEKEQSEIEEEIVPLTEVLKSENQQEETKPVEEEVKQEVQPNKVESFDYEKEFETYGYKLNPEKKDDPRYLAGKFFSTAGLLKQVSTEKKQLDEQYKSEKEAHESKIAELQKKLADLNSSKPEMSTASIENEIDDLEKEFEEFEVDPKFVKLLDKRYKNSNKSNEYEKKIQELNDKLEGFQKDSYESRFWNEVYSKAPEAKSVSNAELDVWLEQPLYGNTTKKDIYLNALNKGDTETVAKLFSDCMSDLNKETDTINKPIPDNIKAQISAQPIHKSSNNSVKGKPVFTQQQIAMFDEDVRRGKITKEEADRIEDEIQLAYIEGRVH